MEQPLIKRAVFAVSLPAQPPVYMCTEWYPDGTFVDRMVVIVDAQKFLALWRMDPHGHHREEAFGTPDTWPQDGKYPFAVAGFARGITDPVPLARVEIYYKESVMGRIWGYRRYWG